MSQTFSDKIFHQRICSRQTNTSEHVMETDVPVDMMIYFINGIPYISSLSKLSPILIKLDQNQKYLLYHNDILVPGGTQNNKTLA